MLSDQRQTAKNITDYRQKLEIKPCMANLEGSEVLFWNQKEKLLDQRTTELNFQLNAGWNPEERPVSGWAGHV